MNSDMKDWETYTIEKLDEARALLSKGKSRLAEKVLTDLRDYLQKELKK